MIRDTARRHLHRHRVHHNRLVIPLVNPDVGNNAKILKKLHTLDLASSVEEPANGLKLLTFPKSLSNLLVGVEDQF